MNECFSKQLQTWQYLVTMLDKPFPRTLSMYVLDPYTEEPAFPVLQLIAYRTGNQCIPPNMESQRGLRRGGALGSQQDANRLPSVRIEKCRKPRYRLIVARFFVHKSIQSFAEAIIEKHGKPLEQALLFPTHAIAERCASFLHQQDLRLSARGSVRIIDLYPDSNHLGGQTADGIRGAKTVVSAVVYPKSSDKAGKTFWQHSGEGISSRRAEYCRKAFDGGHLSTRESIQGSGRQPIICKGPRRYQKKSSQDIKDQPLSEQPPQPPPPEPHDFAQFVEERFGRNLDVILAANAKKAIRRRIAGALCANADCTEVVNKPEASDGNTQGRTVSENDVYLYPCGMSAIFNAHRTLMRCRGELKSISYGFPYIDTLKILEKWGPGCIFYGQGDYTDLDDLETRCRQGERFLALFCEFPGNPLLKTPDLVRIRDLAQRYDFAVVVDETIGNFINVDVLPYADIVVSSLTKVFTGECNVMGGSLVLNPDSRYHQLLQKTMTLDYEDNYWPEDAIFMERNSRDFVDRIHRINANAEMVCDALKASPAVKEIFYPKYNASRRFYEQCRNKSGGYGGLLSVTFHTKAQASHFFDKLETAKGPSLGTNFTLSSPYVVLAHYGELDWVRQFGVDPDLIRVSVGLEDPRELQKIFERALAALKDF